MFTEGEILPLDKETLPFLKTTSYQLKLSSTFTSYTLDPHTSNLIVHLAKHQQVQAKP